MDFIWKIIPCLAAAAVIGFLTGLFWSARRRLENWLRDKEKLESKVSGYERDLDKARGEVRTHRDQVNSLKSELAGHADKLKLRDVEVGDLQLKLTSFGIIEAELASKKSELSTLTADFGSLRSKLAEAEAALKKPAEPDPQLVGELNRLKQELSSKETEINTLLGRVKELAPLNLQIKDRDLRIKDLETAHLDIIKGKDSELAKLTARIGELQAESTKAASHLSTFEARLEAKDNEVAGLTARITELETSSLPMAEHEAALNKKDVEISGLLVKLGELETANNRIAEFEAKLQSAEAAWTDLFRDKEAEISGLQARIGKLEAARADADGARLDEILMLRARLSDLEPLQAAIKGKDDEILMLQAMVGDLQPLKSRLDECGSKLREAESMLRAQASMTEAEAKLARLRSRVYDLETMHNRAVNPPPKGEWDDLEAINGVGPVLEKMLHKLGIYTFKQVALWNEEQIEWVDSLLEHFKGRIVREGWVESAKEEHFKKYAERA